MSTDLDTVIADAIAPSAAETDRTGAFPRAGLEALGKAGLLGLTSAVEVGGGGQGLRAAAEVVTALAAVCGSTAMITLMHYSATAALEAHGPEEVRRAIAEGRYLAMLAFSEAGSRSHFWAPVSTATDDGGEVRLDASKSFVTAAGEADGYVWSSRPLSRPGPMTLWLVPRDAAGLRVTGSFDGLGLRANASSPMAADGVRVPADAMLGTDGDGLDIALATVLPTFLVLNAACSVGVIEALTAKAGEHLSRTHLAHLGRRLADQPQARSAFARVRTRADQTRAFLDDTLTALETGREDATLRVLQVKAVAAEAAAAIGDDVMRLCGGSALRRDLGIERHFRDALAARVMAPTTEALEDFVGRVSLGLPLFDGPAS
ncbi:acyl-CoA dehydrogenase family protein [Nonomuraea cavernae]|uniref:Acyl-CoA dehydrogenase n=1 Tax=Nonomuraea cavernae TaxID=2045107 RepID=A0A917YXB2_9ACTN|nr:acyl-CoA dehydrogenase family protein [Nonomuraea cavernae]MCA2185577.1 acyl-CoA/acyl-ACP dehydrogenase [Nonomuraea cavernae]GGO66891.1 acyl-CoA dehydrogenase [Nonomuraea cavernae]